MGFRIIMYTPRGRHGMYEAERFTVATVVDLMENDMHKVAQTGIFMKKSRKMLLIIENDRKLRSRIQWWFTKVVVNTFCLKSTVHSKNNDSVINKAVWPYFVWNFVFVCVCVCVCVCSDNLFNINLSALYYRSLVLFMPKTPLWEGLHT